MILQKNVVGRFSFVDFYLARAMRIAPAYFVMLGIVTLCAAILFTPKDFDIYWQSAKYAMCFDSNNYFSGFGDYFAPSVHELPLLHTWSLAIEMQFYLLLPALLVFLPGKILKPTVMIIILGFFVFGMILVSDGGKNGSYFSLLVRVPEFLVGTLLALFLISNSQDERFLLNASLKNWLTIIGLSLILYSFIFINEDMNFPGALIALPCVGATCVIAGHGGIMSRMLSSATMVWIGGLSYSLYLWHWPVFSFVRYVTQRYEMKPLVLVGSLVIVLLLSYVSFRWVEAPFRRRNWPVRKRIVPTLLLVLGIFTPILTAQQVNAAIEVPLPIEYTRYADPSKICHGKAVEKCLRGSSREDDSHPVLVLGDSHAAQLNLFFDRIGERTDKKYRVITASSCVTIPKFDLDRLPEWARKDCQTQIDLAQRFLPDSNKIIIAAMWQYQLQSKSFIGALNDFLSASQAAGKRVIVLWQIPTLTANFQRMRRFGVLGIPTDIKADDGWNAANKQVSEIVKHYSNVTFIDFSGDEFFAEVPFYSNTLIYSDKDHLNEVGAVLYADHFIERIKN